MADQVLARDSERPSRGPRSQNTSPLRVYKPGQGKHVRWGTAAGAGVISVAGAAFTREYLTLFFGGNSGFDQVMVTLIPVVLLVGLAVLIFWLLGRNRTVVDFMIATEGEMKKVNWSTRKEVLGATKVVIFTVLALGMMLFVVDLVFMLLFSAIGVLRVPIWASLLGTSAGQ